MVETRVDRSKMAAQLLMQYFGVETTPWGPVQSIEAAAWADEIGEYDVIVSTASHGGYVLTDKSHARVCEACGGEFATYAGGRSSEVDATTGRKLSPYGRWWYEEDCDAAVAVMVLSKDERDRREAASYVMIIHRAAEARSSHPQLYGADSRPSRYEGAAKRAMELLGCQTIAEAIEMTVEIERARRERLDREYAEWLAEKNDNAMGIVYR